MTTNTTQAEATPPIPAPAFLPDAQVWQTAFGAWVLHDAKPDFRRAAPAR